jgi:hypothetical protein
MSWPSCCGGCAFPPLPVLGAAAMPGATRAKRSAFPQTLQVNARQSRAFGGGLGWRCLQDLKPCNRPLVRPSTLGPNHAGRDGVPGNPNGNDSNRVPREQRERGAHPHAPGGNVNRGGLALDTEVIRHHYEPDWNCRRYPLRPAEISGRGASHAWLLVLMLLLEYAARLRQQPSLVKYQTTLWRMGNRREVRSVSVFRLLLGLCALSSSIWHTRRQLFSRFTHHLIRGTLRRRSFVFYNILALFRRF